jgi:molybdopterin converting factor subunit 1
MKVLAFGIVKDIFSGPSAEIEAGHAASVTKLKRLLEERYPGLAKLGSYMIAVNNEYASDAQMISEGDEVAIIPPVSGG